MALKVYVPVTDSLGITGILTPTCSFAGWSVCQRTARNARRWRGKFPATGIAASKEKEPRDVSPATAAEPLPTGPRRWLARPRRRGRGNQLHFSGRVNCQLGIKI